MDSSITLISTFAIAFGVALVLGFIAEKLKFPALVGYLIAGILVSPNVLGFDIDFNLAEQLAEIGIMLLMFGVGLNFSLSDLLKVKKLVIPGAICQMLLSAICAFGLAYFWGWPIGQCVILGMCLSCASTVVVLKGLEAKGLLESFDGRIAVGWLIVQDMVTVLMLVLLPPLASMLGGQSDTSNMPLWQLILETVARVVAFIVFMLVIGKRVLPWLLWQVAKTGSRELFTLCVLAVAIGIAFGASQIFNVSFALGAFFAGMVMRESQYAHRAATESLPLRDAFSVIFFVGVGMMFDPTSILAHPGYLIGILFLILVMNPLIAFATVLLFRYPLHTGFTLACCLGQIGEFSFILGTLGVSLKLLTTEGMNLVLAAAILTIAVNQLSFTLVEPLTKLLCKHFKWARVAAARPDPQATMPDEIDSSQLLRHVVVVGYDSVGQKICEALGKADIPFVVIDRNDGVIEQLRNSNHAAIQGDCTDPAILLQAHVQNSAQIIITIRDELESRKCIEGAKILNPEIEAIIRAETDTEANQMRADHLGIVVQASTALASRMTQYSIYCFTKYDPAKASGKMKNAAEKAKELLDEFVSKQEEQIEQNTSVEISKKQENKDEQKYLED